MSNITEEDVMKYCQSRNLMLVTKESLEYMHRPIVIETMNKNAIPVEWIEKWLDKTTGTRDGDDISQLPEQLKFAIGMINLMEMEWEKENETN